jgi:carbon storage regulator
MAGMCVLTRKPGETVVIGNVIVTFIRLKGGAIRLGIEAPSDVRILRGELMEWKTEGGKLVPCLIELEEASSELASDAA